MGVLWILIEQLTGSGATIVAASIVFFAGGLTIIALAVALRGQAPPPKTRMMQNTTGYQRLYHRFFLGFELAGAWRAVRG